MTRIGKVARLPREIREQVNRRLLDGEQGKSVVEWLNSLPKAQAVLKAEFGGRQVSEQNLSEWKAGGYLDWLRQQESCDVVRHLVEQTNDLGNAAGGVEVSARLSTLLAVELAQTARTLLQETDDPQERWQRLQEILGRLAQLRREEFHAGRLEVERERWEAEQKAAEARKKANAAFFPLHAVNAHHAFYRLMEETTPGARAAAIQCMSRFLPETQPAEAGPANPDSAPGSALKPVQGSSRKASPKDQAQSNQFKPNPGP